MPIGLKIFGGLGNQILQFLFLHWLRSNRGYAVVPIVVTSEREGTAGSRAFQLDRLFPDEKFCSGRAAVITHMLSLSKKYQGTVGKALLRHIDLRQAGRWAEIETVFDGIMPARCPIVTGYFQFQVPILSQKDYALIASSCARRRRGATLAPFLRAADFDTDNDCILHIRRGDYLSTGFPLAGPAYYRDAVSRLSAAGMSGRVFYVSDEPDAAAAILVEAGVSATYLSLDDPLDVMTTISLSRFKVIANSTLSFCGALLGDDACVVYPTIWPNGGAELPLVARQLRWMEVAQ